MSPDEIRNQLQKVLKNEPSNINKILELSTKLAKSDRNNVRFSVDAGVIDRLGKELVARHETAVSELIKNAYDADATKVYLNFENVDKKGGSLTIIDNGTGMTRERLINGFMRISSTDKIHHPISITYKRQRAGKKGIGRFATQRLGDELKIVTKTLSSKESLKVTIDWNKYKMDEELFMISNQIEVIQKEAGIVSGTTLTINNLRESWSDAMIKRVYRYALDIVQPFPISKKKIVNGKINDPGFTIICAKEGVPIADEQSMFYNHAMAEIEGFVDEKGRGYWEIKESKVDVITSKPQRIESDIKNSNGYYKHLNGVRFRAFYFVYNKKQMSKQVSNYIRELSKSQGGIRVYNNGFRALPYGESKNDWLGLDASVRRRTILPTHGNNNFFGFIEINGKNNEFQELSSREGLFHNKAYEELIEFTYKGLTAAVVRIASARNVKTTTNQEGWKSNASRNSKVDILDAAEELDKIAVDLEKKIPPHNDKLNDTKRRNQEKAEDFRRKAETLRKAVEQIEEINMLRVLAGLGLIIGEFTHEIMQYLGTFDVDSQYLVDNLDRNLETFKRAERLQKTFNSFQVYASYFDESISKNVSRDLSIINLKSVINNFKESLETDLKRNDISLLIDFNNNDEIYTRKMHESEWASILFNLYSNAKKALKRKNPSKKEIKIQAGTTDKNIYLHFLDNGDGIPIDNQEKIFNAFFTTSSPKKQSAASKNEMSGTGLGLKILHDIISGYDGEIFLDNPLEGYATNFRIELPKATNKEIDELWDIN